MPTLPTVRSGATCLYPVTRTSTYKTTVLSFVGDAEQRFVSQRPVQDFILQYTNIEGYDVGVLRQFWSGQGGASTSEFDFILDGATYHHCVFASDSFQTTSGKGLTLNCSLAFRQVRT